MQAVPVAPAVCVILRWPHSQGASYPAQLQGTPLIFFCVQCLELMVESRTDRNLLLQFVTHHQVSEQVFEEALPIIHELATTIKQSAQQFTHFKQHWGRTDS